MRLCVLFVALVEGLLLSSCVCWGTTSRMFGWFKSPKGVRVRDAKSRDVRVLLDIFRRTVPGVYYGIVPESHIAKRIQEAEIALRGAWPIALVLEEGGLVGGVSLVRDGSHISMLWLDEPFQGRGLGQMLFAEVERRVARAGHDRMTLEVYKDNKRAVHFYEKNGWRIVKQYPGRVGAIVLDMEKKVMPRG